MASSPQLRHLHGRLPDALRLEGLRLLKYGAAGRAARLG
jgi:hypothetical protein